MSIVNPTISVINLATSALPWDLNAWCNAAMQMLKTDFAPIWGYTATLQVVTGISPTTTAAQLKFPGEYGLVIWENSDSPGALGYHDNEGGKPLTHAFLSTTIKDGEDFSVTMDHELKEMLLDAPAMLWCTNPKTNVNWALEACDAVEQSVYNKNGFNWSNFITPAYFGFEKGTQYDFLKQCSTQWQILKGGYSILQAAGKISQKFGSEEKKKAFAKEDRRFHRSHFRALSLGHKSHEIPECVGQA